MKLHRMCTALLVVLAFSLSAGAAIAEKARPEEDRALLGCSIEGTWHGFNELGETFVITITRTGLGTFSGVGQSPALPPDPFIYPGVVAGFYGTQGDLTRTGFKKFDTTWMSIWRLDPDIWLGFDLGAIVSYGEITMPDCDTWQATFHFDAFGYNFGQDPFEDGFVVDSGGPFAATYKRLPEYPQ